MPDIAASFRRAFLLAIAVAGLVTLLVPSGSADALPVPPTPVPPAAPAPVDRSDRDAPEAPAPPDEEGGEAPAAEVEVLVLNAGYTAGLAGSVGSYLEDNGYTVTDVTNAQPGIYTTSQIVAADATDPAAVALAEELGGLPVTPNDTLEPGTIIVVTHDDYAGPQGDAPLEPSPTEQVGTPGADVGEAEVAPEIDAGGDGPRCVN